MFKQCFCCSNITSIIPITLTDEQQELLTKIKNKQIIGEQITNITDEDFPKFSYNQRTFFYEELKKTSLNDAILFLRRFHVNLIIQNMLISVYSGKAVC